MFYLRGVDEPIAAWAATRILDLDQIAVEATG
jgi:hypothetical protein